MCNLYNMTSNQKAILDPTRAMRDGSGNMPSLPGIYPDYPAPIVREGTDGGRELAMARWGMPTPPQFLKTATGKPKKTDPGVTNIRNVKSPHWRRWLGPESRCLVPFTAFSEPGPGAKGPDTWTWFALSDDRPLAFFAGIWTNWTSVRKLKEGKITIDLFGFLTTTSNDVVAPIHPKAMPVILTDPADWETWLKAPTAEALKLQRPLADDQLVIVPRPTSAKA
jgi:putative SOS response-associated peptidase YedK